jgi:glutaredoxin
VTLYTKPGCCLCGEMRALVWRLSARWRIEVEEVDVSRRDDLLARYGPDLPVLAIEDAYFRHWATEVAVERVLQEKGASLR